MAGMHLVYCRSTFSNRGTRSTIAILRLANRTDGGTDLIDSRAGWPTMNDLPWGTADLGDALAKHCELQSFTLERVDGSFDVDTKLDLEYAAKHLLGDPRPARGKLVEEIRRLKIS